LSAEREGVAARTDTMSFIFSEQFKKPEGGHEFWFNDDGPRKNLAAVSALDMLEIIKI
jgi:hypothetical protein